MKKALYIPILLFVGLAKPVLAQESPLFPKGEKSPNVHHVGNVWLTELNAPDSVFAYGTSVAIFDPGARLDWHSHPGGQILIITEGVGYYQEKGKPKQIVKRGEVVKCQPGVEHWHGATPESGVTYIATSPSQKGKTIWLERVTDQEYKGKK
ncbi:cupin domain-containing protein [Pedobacter gandavensis]|uniref:cupin domain-containing protein n=1 Tax=Pedobacter gandavensis TaxID=2679963 RepID=UPI002478D201|nr:cupin domain-containing protein [Pedobacter gandavensis]WGQ09887.1 cupin domain-containing protein [Pedobacter gandavensis]